MLELKEITKKYNRIPVVKQVSFTLQRGDILGYLGPNGAGKSTTVKILAGMIEADGGSIYLDGKQVDPTSLTFRKHIGYLPEQSDLYPHLTGFEYLELMGQLRQIPQKQLHLMIKGLLEGFGLSVEMNMSIASYSKGMRQKVMVASCLLHNPDILLLDEPLTGMDVFTMLVFKDTLKHLAQMGKMVIYSSHILEVVEKVCTRVIILNKGKILADDSVAGLTHLMALPSLESIFTELVHQPDTSKVAEHIIDIIGHNRVAA